jgi:quercetin dioxygenase-like cupin family protein
MTTTRLAVLMAMTLSVGVVTGVAASRAADIPVKRAMLIQTPLVENGTGERLAQMYITEIAPGVDAGRHFHHGHTFVYVLEGALVIHEDGKTPVTFEAGQAFDEQPGFRHGARNPSATKPVKLLIFQAPLKGQPLAEALK